ncbi:MAG: fructosamine kinase family protein [Gallionella sp.]|nr:fructosamine kinase family protein [Gallionella sp.]
MPLQKSRRRNLLTRRQKILRNNQPNPDEGLVCHFGLNLYNPYRILNHANWFGGGYARQAEQMMQRLLPFNH